MNIAIEGIVYGKIHAGSDGQCNYCIMFLRNLCVCVNLNQLEPMEFSNINILAKGNFWRCLSHSTGDQIGLDVAPELT